jgi:hypothetical protein
LLKPHELTNLIEGETKVLPTFDEPTPVNHGARISPHAGAALWDNKCRRW